SVSVYARNPTDRESRFTTHCILVFVAVDGDGKPTPVPAFAPDTPRERRLLEYARKMIELRQNMQDEAQAFLHDMAADQTGEELLCGSLYPARQCRAVEQALVTTLTRLHHPIRRIVWQRRLDSHE